MSHCGNCNTRKSKNFMDNLPIVGSDGSKSTVFICTDCTLHVYKIEEGSKLTLHSGEEVYLDSSFYHQSA